MHFHRHTKKAKNCSSFNFISAEPTEKVTSSKTTKILLQYQHKDLKKYANKKQAQLFLILEGYEKPAQPTDQ
jgi:hypothetical protein